MKGINLFDFQEQAVKQLLKLSEPYKNSLVVTVKSPTGSGKTIMLIEYVSRYLKEIEPKTAFVWLCPGKGNLEEQSMEKMQHFIPSLDARTLDDTLKDGFADGSCTFINWELVTKTGNNAIKESEKKNLFDRIREAHLNGTEFIIIIDEEHSNKTAKAQYIIDKIEAKHIIRVSATAKQNKKNEFMEIDEQDVIDAGLITKAIYVNPSISDNPDIEKDYDILLDAADQKRKELRDAYKSMGSNVNPLVLIQFPSGKPETIEQVEQKLEEMGYSYDNKMVSIWMSGKKIDLPDNLTENNGGPAFLLMKQAISTGWDCPRAKILVKLREGMSEDFTIQTIGRIRRMPERKHYDNDLMDCCYVYTFDEKYKTGLLSELDKSYEVEKLYVKNKCKTFVLRKQTRDNEYSGIGEREILLKIHKHMTEKYHLTEDTKENQKILESHGYVFGSQVIGHILQGRFVTTGDLAHADESDYITIKSGMNSGSGSKHTLQVLRVIDDMKQMVGLQQHQLRSIFRRMFSSKVRSKYRILNLSSEEFFAFIINNAKQLKIELREVSSQIAIQLSLHLVPKEMDFRIPEEDLFRYDPKAKSDEEYMSNAFKKYSAGNITSKIRSLPEQLFEQYCEECGDLDWVYKNGDAGSQYFSIVYLNGAGNQQLFYPDYIAMKNDGSVWIIETKGGEQAGHSKNIDLQAENKFNALRDYCKKQKINWAFVRDSDNHLYANNTKYTEDMMDKRWIPLSDIF